MSRVEVTQASAPLSDGILQTDLPIDGTPQVVKDQLGNSSTLLLANDETQINSTLRVHTDSAELLDLEDNGSNNRFNINRDVQKINLDFASKPSDITTQVGAIRTAQDGVNLSDAVKFQENGQVTFTERVKIESDSTVSTQTSSVIQATTTNASLVLSPNGTGAIIASVPDGTATGGNARGQYAVDLQSSRTSALQVASGNTSVIIGGYSNRSEGINSTVLGGNLNVASGNNSMAGGNNCSASGSTSLVIGQDSSASAAFATCFGRQNAVSSTSSVVSGGQSNTASTNTHATVVGGQSNTSSGQYSVSGGSSNTISGTYSVGFGWQNQVAGSAAFSFGAQNSSTQNQSGTFGQYAFSYITGQISQANGRFSINGDSQFSNIVSRNSAALTSGSTLILYANGSNAVILPDGLNRSWNVQVSWVAVVTAITGTATGVTVGDTKTSTDLLAVARRGGSTTVSAHTSAGTQVIETIAGSLTTANITYSTGGVQQMALTFTAPTFAGGGSVTMRVVAKVQLTEVAY